MVSVKMKSKTKKPPEKKTTVVEQKSKLRLKLIFATFWLGVLVVAIILLNSLFKPQWSTIYGRVVALMSEPEEMGEDNGAQVQIDEVIIEQAPIEIEASQEAALDNNVEFIEGLIKVILSASEEAEVASAAAGLEELE